MNRLIHILTTVSLATAMLLAAGCAKVEWNAQGTDGEETVVSFTASLQHDAATKAAESYEGYKLVCAVFENGAELRALREVVTTSAGKADFTPRLIKGHTYSVVFWAMADGVYNVESMKNIFLNPEADHKNADAFTARTEYTVNETAPETVTLCRPLSRVNLGVIPGSAEIAPERIVMKIKSYAGYDAVSQSFAGEISMREYAAAVAGGEFVVNDVTYTLLMSCFPFADDVAGRLEYTIYGRDSMTGEGTSVSKAIDPIPLQVNYTTNIVGDLLKK